MKTTGTGRAHRYLGALAVLGALSVLAPAVPVQAQDVVAGAQESCRCVDRDGNEIENCTCFRALRGQYSPLRLRLFDGQRARIGVTVDPTQSADDDARGARITDVMDEGPADEAGLREDDIIVSIDGQSLFDRMDAEVEADFDLDQSIPVQRLLAAVQALEPGEEVEVEYLRDGDTRTTTLEARELNGWGRVSLVSPDFDVEVLSRRMEELRDRVGDAQGRYFFRTPDSAATAWHFEMREPDADAEGWVRPRVLMEQIRPEGRALAYTFQGGWMFNECPTSEDEAGYRYAFGTNCMGGVELLELSPGLASYFEVDRGVLVTDVHEESPTGLEAGDIILAIGDREVATPSQVRRILGSYTEDEDVNFRILRRGSEMSVQGSLSR